MINTIHYDDQIDHDYFNLYIMYKNKFKDDKKGFNIAMAKAKEVIKNGHNR